VILDQRAPKEKKAIQERLVRKVIQGKKAIVDCKGHKVCQVSRVTWDQQDQQDLQVLKVI